MGEIKPKPLRLENHLTVPVILDDMFDFSQRLFFFLQRLYARHLAVLLYPDKDRAFGLFCVDGMIGISL